MALPHLSWTPDSHASGLGARSPGHWWPRVTAAVDQERSGHCLRPDKCEATVTFQKDRAIPRKCHVPRDGSHTTKRLVTPGERLEDCGPPRDFGADKCPEVRIGRRSCTSHPRWFVWTPNPPGEDVDWEEEVGKSATIDRSSGQLKKCVPHRIETGTLRVRDDSKCHHVLIPASAE